MPPGSYTTQQLAAVIPSLQVPPLFLLSTFFPNTILSEQEEVFFDKIADDIRIAPLVSPVVQGRVVEDQAFRTEYIIPAYTKFKYPLRPRDLIRRTAGERIGGELSQAQRKAAIVAQRLAQGRAMWQRRLEFMASEVLRTGQLTVTGEGFGTRVLNYGRAAGLTVTLTLTARWSDAGSNPLLDLETWSRTAQQTEGGGPLVRYVMDPAAFNLFKARITARDELSMLNTEIRGNASALNLGPLADKVTYAGRVGSFEIWVYQDWYENEAGVQTAFMPANTVIGVGNAIGTKLFGAIQDFDNLAATDFHAKTFVEDDPSVEYLLCQSAPILACGRINATFCATVA